VLERNGATVSLPSVTTPLEPWPSEWFAPTRYHLVLTSFGIRPPHPDMLRLMEALDRIAIHVPFEVTPSWVARSTQRPSALRNSSLIEPPDRLSKLGANLANAFAALKNDFDDRHWQDTMAYVRLGLGDGVESVNVRPDPGGGSVALWMKYAGLEKQLPAAALSDGTLAYLALVALYRLDTASSLVAFDEPELHLHPALLMRALDFFEAMAQERPVILATHSDRLLDGLTDPARSTVLCELDEDRRTRLVRPDPEALERWLTRYRGLGDIRGAGHQASVMTREERSTSYLTQSSRMLLNPSWS
jgi:predicted ATPase